MGIQGPKTMRYSHGCNMFQPLEYVSVHMRAIAIVYSHSPPVMTHGNFSPHKFPWMTPPWTQGVDLVPWISQPLEMAPRLVFSSAHPCAMFPDPGLQRPCCGQSSRSGRPGEVDTDLGPLNYSKHIDLKCCKDGLIMCTQKR